METSSTDTVRYGIGARAARLRRRLTLDELAEVTGLSKSHLSRFERGKKSLSLAALMRVAAALDTFVSNLLGEQVEDNVLHVARRADRRVRADDGALGYGYALLSRAQANGRAQAFLVDIARQGRRVSQAYHAGDEMVFVTAGRIEIELADRTILLLAGDYLQFPGHLKHTAKGLDAENQMLMIVVEE